MTVTINSVQSLVTDTDFTQPVRAAKRACGYEFDAYVDQHDYLIGTMTIRLGRVYNTKTEVSRVRKRVLAGLTRQDHYQHACEIHEEAMRRTNQNFVFEHEDSKTIRIQWQAHWSNGWSDFYGIKVTETSFHRDLFKVLDKISNHPDCYGGRVSPLEVLRSMEQQFACYRTRWMVNSSYCHILQHDLREDALRGSAFKSKGFGL